MFSTYTEKYQQILYNFDHKFLETVSVFKDYKKFTVFPPQYFVHNEAMKELSCEKHFIDFRI